MSGLGTDESIRVLLNAKAPALDRAVAARLLPASEGGPVLDALIQVATDPETVELVGFAVGESIAEILIRLDTVDRVPLQDFNQSAFVGYDQAIARYLNGQGRPAA